MAGGRIGICEGVGAKRAVGEQDGLGEGKMSSQVVAAAKAAGSACGQAWEQAFGRAGHQKWCHRRERGDGVGGDERRHQRLFLESE